jgi:parvulin-like peptidyl-prolyl isomerase
MSFSYMTRRWILVGFLWIPFLMLVACGDKATPTAAPTTAVLVATATIPGQVQETPLVEPASPATPTDVPPSPTPSPPVAALVNEQPIYLATFEKELARYEQAQAELGLAPVSGANSNYRALVLDALVEQALIFQAAEARDLSITTEMVDQKLGELEAAAGSPDNFNAWLEANQWTRDEFHEALAAEMLTEQVVAQVTAEVPFAVEQVRARYLQVADSALARSLLERIQNGEDFATLAEENSLDRFTAQSGGDLGFFARGSLLVPSVEAAAFALQPGDVSEIITDTSLDGSQTVYYLVQLIERDPQRPLTADLRYTLLQQAFENWLDTQWEQATIIRFIDTDA